MLFFSSYVFDFKEWLTTEEIVPKELRSDFISVFLFLQVLYKYNKKYYKILFI